MNYLKQSTTTTIQLGPFLDDTDGKTAEEGLTLASTDFWLSKAGAAFANPNDTNAGTHDRAGWYRKQLNATDTATLGRIMVSVHESGALPVWREFMVLPANVFDSLVAGSDYLEVDIEAISGDETAADNLELDYDGTGLAKANSTIGTVTTNTDLVTAVAIRTEIDSNSSQLTAIVADTDELQTDDVPGLIGALNDPTAVAIRTEIDSNSSQLAAIVADTGELQTDDVPGLIAALNNISTADLTAALTALHLDHLLAVEYDPASKPGAPTALLNELVESDGGVSRFTENALEQAPSGTGASAATIADAVWEELIADHSGTSGSTAEALAGASAPSAADVADAVLDEALAGHVVAGSLGKAVADIESDVTAVLADTNELQTDDIPSQISALNDPTAAAVADAVLDEALAGHVAAGSLGKAAADIETDVTAVLADTDELQQDDVPGLIGALNDPTAAAVADQVWEEAIADHSGTSGSTAEALDAAGGGSTPATIADAVWEETLTDHSGTSGSTAEALSNIPGASKGAIEYAYTIDDGVDPIEGAEVWITTDSGGNNVIWSGVSDALGIARASDDEKPWLDAGTYYGWAQKTGFSFSNPDTLTVS